MFVMNTTNDMSTQPTDPMQVFLQGGLTLGELEGVDKASQYEGAERGYTLLSEGKTQAAQEVFFGLVALDPYDAYFWAALGVAHEEAGDVDPARTAYERALAINPFFGAARLRLGELRLLAGDIENAVQDLMLVIEQDPQGEEPSTDRARGILDAIESQIEAASSGQEQA